MTRDRHEPQPTSEYRSSELVGLKTGQLKQRSSYSRRMVICSSIFCIIMITLALVAVIVGGVTYVIMQRKYPDMGDELHWDWNKINLKDVDFPKSFLWGVSTAAHQIEGGSNNNQWFQFERTEDPVTHKTPIDNGDVSGKAADHWNNYKNDIEMMKSQLHVNSYRFSIEWSKIEINHGEFNKDAIRHYHDVINTLLENEIEPIITLHYNTEPLWFTEMGGFEKDENIKCFVNFSEAMFREYSEKVKKWVTFNAPNVYAMLGYNLGEYPPAKKSMKTAGGVMKNLAEAHVQVYGALKKLSGSNATSIGIALNMQQFDPANSTSTLDRMVAKVMNDMYTGSFYGFFSTGTFAFSEPGQVDIKYTNMDAIHSLDFIGINYYGNNYVKFDFQSKSHFKFITREGDIQTDMGWPIYAEGIYRAIKYASELQLPIYITENGIPDRKDTNRELFIKRYLYAVSKAIKDGYNVKGYMYFSLMDGFHWQKGYTMKFGLFETDFRTQKRILRKGSQSFINIVRKFRRV